MASFQQDAGDVQFPFVPHSAPRPDTSKARVIGLLGNLGLQAVEGKIQADLVGPKQPDVAFDATDVSPSEQNLVNATHDDLRQLALNDKPGDWRVRVRDVASGVFNEKYVEVE